MLRIFTVFCLIHLLALANSASSDRNEDSTENYSLVSGDFPEKPSKKSLFQKLKRSRRKNSVDNTEVEEPASEPVPLEEIEKRETALGKHCKMMRTYLPRSIATQIPSTQYVDEICKGKILLDISKLYHGAPTEDNIRVSKALFSSDFLARMDIPRPKWQKTAYTSEMHKNLIATLKSGIHDFTKRKFRTEGKMGKVMKKIFKQKPKEKDSEERSRTKEKKGCLSYDEIFNRLDHIIKSLIYAEDYALRFMIPRPELERLGFTEKKYQKKDINGIDNMVKAQMRNDLNFLGIIRQELEQELGYLMKFPQIMPCVGMKAEAFSLIN